MPASKSEAQITSLPLYLAATQSCWGSQHVAASCGHVWPCCKGYTGHSEEQALSWTLAFLIPVNQRITKRLPKSTNKAQPSIVIEI